MSLRRLPALTLVLALATAARVAAASVTADRSALAGQPWKVRQAFDTLRTATCFESTHIGDSGVLSTYVAAFRVIYQQPEAAALFRVLSTDAGRAGQLYALSGFYFTEPVLFHAEIERLRQRGGRVCVMHGCIRTHDWVSNVLEAKGDRIRIPLGRTLEQRWAEQKATTMDDISGGSTPLSFLEGDVEAPRDPL
jgi:hypothetical protein